MRNRIRRIPLIWILAALMLSPYALADLSMEERGVESCDPYTLGDLAAARFAVYGLLDEHYRTPQKDTARPLSRLDAVQLLFRVFSCEDDPSSQIPFTDVPEDYWDAVSWAYTNGMARGCAPKQFGAYSVTERAFVTMLLNALGFRNRFSYADALSYGESVGLIRPVGISEPFSLGDACLYLQAALRMTTPKGTPMRIRMNIPQNADGIREQAAFPVEIRLYPVSMEDALTQIDLATRCLARSIVIYPDRWTADGIMELYRQFARDVDGGDVWYLPRLMDEDPIEAALDIHDYAWTEVQIQWFMGVRRDLDERKANGELTGAEYRNTLDRIRLEQHLSAIHSLTLLIPRYNEAWKLACDTDDAFTFLEDDTLSREADQFYQHYVSHASTPKEAVLRAKRAIVNRASYAAESADRTVYPDDAHFILGFFKDGRVVCDGYAKVFQYLMHRAEVPCVVVYGSTVSRANAEKGDSNHAWNKVKIGGQWLNVDTCWADTGWGSALDMKDDEYYADCRHWPVTHTALQ